MQTGTSIFDGRWFRNAATALLRTIPSRRKKEFIALMYANRFWDQDRLKFDSAQARVNDCLDVEGEKKQFLKISEIWAWMRASGEHELFLAMAEDLGYRVERIPDATRVNDMLDRIDARLGAASDALEDVRAFRSEIAALLAGNQSAAASPGNGDATIRFCQGGEDKPPTF
jgi:hypothetical protein